MSESDHEAAARRHRHRADNVTFYLPVTTSILVSVVLSVILWLMGR